jgi:hypothetical protein
MQLWPETACSQVGYHIDYTPDELRERYGSPQNYIDQVTESPTRREQNRLLVSAGAERTIEESKMVSFSASSRESGDRG